MKADRIRMLLRWCRGRELGIGRFSRTLSALSDKESNVSAIQQEVYSRNSTAVAFHAVARAMAFGSDNVNTFDLVLDQLGTARVRKAALSAGLLSAVPEANTTQVFCYQSFQRRCLFIAFVLESLAQRLDVEIADEAFLVGLIMDGSYLLMLEHFESDLELSLYTRINNPSLTAAQAEEMYLNFTNAHVSAIIAEDARLHSASIDSLAFVCDPSSYEGKYSRCVDLCHLSSIIADWSGYSIAPGLPHSTLDISAVQRLGLKREFSDHIIDAVEYAREISDQAVSQAVKAVSSVRRFSG